MERNTMQLKSSEQDATDPRVTFDLYRDGNRFAAHTSIRRGGCLYAGWITLRNLATADYIEIPSTGGPMMSPEYIASLWDKHLGPRTPQWAAGLCVGV